MPTVLAFFSFSTPCEGFAGFLFLLSVDPDLFVASFATFFCFLDGSIVAFAMASSAFALRYV